MNENKACGLVILILQTVSRHRQAANFLNMQGI